MYGYLVLLIPIVVSLTVQVAVLDKQLTDVKQQVAEEQSNDTPSKEPVHKEPEPIPEPDPIPDTCKTQRECNEQTVHVYTVAKWGESEWKAMYWLVMKESGFSNEAQNKRSTAYGMFQFLDSTWKGTGYQKTSDPIQQTQAGIEYIERRYGTPSNAVNFHRANGYY